MHDHITDVLIVGAGPTGLTLACDLARRGIPHRIIERAPQPSTASRAKTIQPRALEVLDDLGAAARVMQRGVVDLPTRFHDAAGTVVDRPNIAARVGRPSETPFPDPVWIAQFDVEAALREQHARWNGHVEFGMEATALHQDSTGVAVDVVTGNGVQTIRARYVIGSDGGTSRIRKLVGLPLVGETYEDQRWYLGDVTAPGLDRGYLHVWTSPQGMIGLTPLPGTDLWQLQSPIPTETGEPAPPSLALYQQMLDERAGVGVVRLTSASWLSISRVNVRMVERYRQGRVFLVGDAAHVHPAAGGQGMNTGIQDAYNLGWKLAAVLGGAAPALLDTYEEERLPVAQAVLEDSNRKMQQAQSTMRRESGAGLSKTLGELSDDLTSGLSIAYPTSSLTSGAMTGASALPAGRRAPNAMGLHGPQFDGAVFDLLRGPHWTLLAFTEGPRPTLAGLDPSQVHVHQIGTREGTELQDTTGETTRTYAPDGDELILIRPDGYLAARVPVGQEAAIIGYLRPLLPDHLQHR
ncbi:FAD-dependent monooxygenase [Deinococcus sonorensis]|uniref:FAD-dependent monooxygenase n=2 Tax=Deinococcus sonorensis TaxID=309891 RepID=A0AAU7U6W6_9DEIO